MIFDPRSSEKHIAPHVSEEIDGRNLVSYRYGDELSIPIISQVFQVDSKQNIIFEKELFMPLNDLIPHVTRFSVVLSSDKPGDINWIINANGQTINSELISVSNKQSVARFSAPLGPGINSIKCVFDGVEDKTINVKLRISLALHYDKKQISTSELGVDHFYVEKIILNRGDVVSFDSYGNIFSNQNSKQEIFEFNKPIAIREINFIRGKPKVLFYYFVRTD